MKQWYIFIPITLMVGALLPLQASLNAYLGQYLKHPTQAAVVNFLGGLIIITIISLLITPQIPAIATLRSVPWYYYLGGLLGAIGVSAYILLVREIGALNLMAGAVVGQILFSSAIDHFGWFGVPPHPISWPRILGIVFLIIGLLLAQRN